MLKGVFPLSSGFRIGFLAVVLFVLLRITIGWHFLNEGLDKYLGGEFSSAGFLSQAVGPFAEQFHSLAGDFHGWDRLMAEGADEYLAAKAQAEQEGTNVPDEQRPYTQWTNEVITDWGYMQLRISRQLSLDEQQQAEAGTLLEATANALKTYVMGEQDAMEEYLRKMAQFQVTKANPQRLDRPFEPRWWDKRKQELELQASEWKNWVRDAETDLRKSLVVLADKDEQVAKRSAVRLSPDDRTSVDRVIPYAHIAIGACLIIGLFTRLAAVCGAVFLALVILTQPPWAAGAQPVFYQMVEMVGLLALAATAVGRWGGLDFFIHYLLIRPCCGPKQQTNG